MVTLLWDGGQPNRSSRTDPGICKEHLGSENTLQKAAFILSFYFILTLGKVVEEEDVIGPFVLESCNSLTCLEKINSLSIR